MAKIAKKTDPKLWEKVKTEVTEGGKGGNPGQWSARKAQLATQEYKAEGGGYEGGKSTDNHLTGWTREDWGTKSGAESGKTGERYLPRAAREHLSDAEYKRTTDKKRRDSAKGQQFSAQPSDIAAKTAADRRTDTGSPAGSATREQLLKQAAAKGIVGRSKMKKAELERALKIHG